MADKSNLTRDEARARAAILHDPEYRVELDLTGADGFTSESLIRFRCREAGASTFLDLTAPTLEAAELNGRPIPSDAFDGNRIRLEGLEAENELRVRARCAYHRTELGMHRFVDPVDGKVYLHTDFEPFDAHQVYACFDQPDLKGTFEFSVVAPAGWVVVANSRPAGPPEPQGEAARWTFLKTPPMSTYITAIVAGQYHVVRDQHHGIDLGLYCRQSLADYLDAGEIFEVTKAGFDFFQQAFDYPYPFGKYDQLFIPESNTGAMENAGAVTFNDVYIFRSRVTDAARERRGDTILHEMAHMWFGDLVTMRWWDDLWLNESFASFMAVLSQAEATRWTEAWTTFADTEKTWAYRQDQLPTTHPIVADIPDIHSIYLNFDGITYAKGASVLKQLVAWVGRDAFLEGVRAYCRRHEFGNAELSDFLAALEEASGRDLKAWSKDWLEAAGVNTLRTQFELGRENGSRETFGSFAVVQEAPEEWPVLRPHRIGIGLYDAPDGEPVRLRRRVELDVTGSRTEVPELAGEAVPDLVLVNDADLTFAKVRLDPRSLATALERLGDVEDSLARTLCWTACWDMTRDAEMPARDFVRLVVRHAAREPKVGVLQSLLGQASAAIHVYGDPANREAATELLAIAALEGLRAATPGSDHQLAWARAFVGAARSAEHVALARGLLDGSTSFEGLAVDTEFRWHVVRALAAAGAADDGLIATETDRDPSDRGSRHAGAARAARPDPAAKAAAWRLIVESRDQPLALIEEVMTGFQQYGQEEILVPYTERFFEAIPRVWEARDLPDAIAFGQHMYPRLAVSEATIELTDRHLGDGATPGPMRRLLLEGKDGVRRAIKARAADARAGSAG